MQNLSGTKTGLGNIGLLRRSYLRFSRLAILRFPAQAVAAVAIAYVTARLLGLPDASWAVFSSLFVVQASFDGTVRSALGRLVGAAIGLVLALACIFTFGVGGWNTVLALVVAVAVTGAISVARPELTYALVVAAMLTVAPGVEVIEDGLLKAAAIGVGSAAGTLAALIVFPLSARRSSHEHLAEALRGCARLIEESTRSVTDGAAADLYPVHEVIQREMSEAHRVADEAVGHGPRVDGAWPAPRRLVERVEALWYTLALVDRLSGHRLPPAVRKRIEPDVRRATQACCVYLNDLAAVFGSGRPMPDIQAVEGPIAALSARLDEVRGDGDAQALSSNEIERVFALVFAWEQVDRSLRRLAQALQGEEPAAAG